MPTLSPFERKRVSLLMERYCSNRTVLADTPKIRYTFTIRGTFVTLMEVRLHWRQPNQSTSSKIAQFRRSPRSSFWTLHCRDNRGHWHLFEPATGSKRLDFLLQVVDDDSTGIFYG